MAAAVLSVYTFTLGRPFYLLKSMQSVFDAASTFDGQLSYHICFQGSPVDHEVRERLGSAPGNVRVSLHEWEVNVGIAGGVNRIISEIDSALAMKLDDDCELLTTDFFTHVMALSELIPGSVFSAFPVGVIRPVGGPEAISREVRYSSRTDTYYTLRRVQHVGGLCRVSPTEFVRGWNLRTNLSASGTEDSQQSQRCLAEGIPMYYTENGLVVEHLETAWGQDARLKGYFDEKRRGHGTYERPGFRMRVARAVERRVARLHRSLYRSGYRDP